MLYRDEILDHYKHPHHLGVLKAATHQASLTNASCGDIITLSLKVEENHIQDVGFESQGCALSTASASILSDFLVGKTLEQVQQITQADLLSMLGEVNPGRIKCVLLPLQALQKALVQ